MRLPGERVNLTFGEGGTCGLKVEGSRLNTFYVVLVMNECVCVRIRRTKCIENVSAGGVGLMDADGLSNEHAWSDIDDCVRRRYRLTHSRNHSKRLKLRCTLSLSSKKWLDNCKGEQ